MNFLDNQSINIAVADDDVLIRELLCDHIDTLKNCKILFQANEGQELLAQLKANSTINLVILDIVMPGLGGYETAERISEFYPGMRILFYSACKTELAYTRMFISKAHGLISKWGHSSQIAEAIYTVMNGFYFFPGRTEKISIKNGYASKKLPAEFKELSALEMKFLQLIGTSKTYKDMACCLEIEIRQVDYMRENLFKSFKVKSRTELAILAYRSGLVNLHR
jgi:DNA-binding NarL/FixJ family response regulator